MDKTLLLVPHELAGLPVFGVGWLLIALAVGFTVRLAFAAKSPQPVGEMLASEGLFWAVMAAVVLMLFPAIELKNAVGEPVGMAIRGYGVMLLLGVVSGVAMAAFRAKHRGIDPEHIYSMAPWVFVGGIIGARLFYVIQYKEKFIGDTIVQTIRNVMAFTEGGLVVYGSFIGGFLAACVYIARKRLPLLRFGDAIVPCIFIGMFFGRIGCLMNGCCYGGRCEEGWSAIHFPPGSAVYQEQMFDGQLMGIRYDEDSRKISEITPGSLASEAGIRVGQNVNRISLLETPPELAPRDLPAEDVHHGVSMTIDQQRYQWTADQLPERALPVRAAQVISSVSSLVLCILLCGLSTIIRREGMVMLIGFASYAVLRFVLEIVRVDEGGQFGTEFSISQWVSIFVFTASVGTGLWLLLQKRPTEVESASAPT